MRITNVRLQKRLIEIGETMRRIRKVNSLKAIFQWNEDEIRHPRIRTNFFEGKVSRREHFKINFKAENASFQSRTNLILVSSYLVVDKK